MTMSERERVPLHGRVSKIASYSDAGSQRKCTQRPSHAALEEGVINTHEDAERPKRSLILVYGVGCSRVGEREREGFRGRRSAIVRWRW
jgi:hypothetical protein